MSVVIDGGGVDTSTLLQKTNNLSDILDAPTARDNLGLGTIATAAAGDYPLLSSFSASPTAAEPLKADGSGGLALGSTLSVRKDQAAQTQIQVRNDAAGGFASLSIWSVTERGRMQYNVNSPNIFFTTVGAIPFYIGTSDQVRMTVSSSGLVGIGTTSPATLLHTSLSSAVTNTALNVLTISHETSGTPAAGFGVGIALQLESSTTAAQNAARIATEWNVATHASRRADLALYASDYGGEREGLRIRASGTAAAIGVLGATPIARQTVAANASDLATAITLVNDIKSKLQSFGFFN